jgi:hypothetical protein
LNRLQPHLHREGPFRLQQHLHQRKITLSADWNRDTVLLVQFRLQGLQHHSQFLRRLARELSEPSDHRAFRAASGSPSRRQDGASPSPRRVFSISCVCASVSTYPISDSLAAIECDRMRGLHLPVLHLELVVRLGLPAKLLQLDVGTTRHCLLRLHTKHTRARLDGLQLMRNVADSAAREEALVRLSVGDLSLLILTVAAAARAASRASSGTASTRATRCVAACSSAVRQAMTDPGLIGRSGVCQLSPSLEPSDLALERPSWPP